MKIPLLHWPVQAKEDGGVVCALCDSTPLVRPREVLTLGQFRERVKAHRRVCIGRRSIADLLDPGVGHTKHRDLGTGAVVDTRRPSG